MTRIFGDFTERKDDHGEHLEIGFSPTSIPIQQRWRNNGLSADFLADYLSTFFPATTVLRPSARRISRVRSVTWPMSCWKMP